MDFSFLVSWNAVLVEFFERNLEIKKVCCCFSLALTGLYVMCLTLSDISTSYFGSYNIGPLGRCRTNNAAEVKLNTHSQLISTPYAVVF